MGTYLGCLREVPEAFLLNVVCKGLLYLDFMFFIDGHMFITDCFAPLVASDCVSGVGDCLSISLVVGVGDCLSISLVVMKLLECHGNVAEDRSLSSCTRASCTRRLCRSSSSEGGCIVLHCVP